jgi:hypothetical protein
MVDLRRQELVRVRVCDGCDAQEFIVNAGVCIILQLAGAAKDTHLVLAVVIKAIENG